MVGFPLDSRVTYVTDPDTGAITPQYDRAVTSKPLKAYIRGIITTGVLPNPSDNLQVFPGTDGMTVIVHAGFAVVDGGLAKEDNNRTLEVTASDATYDRIDTVVVRWNDNDSVRNVDLYIKQGVPARNPVRPTLTREGSVYEIGIADVFVTKNVRTITAEKITDTRLESSRCGVASSIAKWDTTTIYQQIQSDLAGFKSNEQAEFMAWFNTMKDQLTEDAAGKLQTEVDNVSTKLQNLQVGGRNLIEDSKGEFSDEYPNSGYTSLGARFANLPAYATQFILSFEAKSTVAGDKISSYFYSPSDIIKTEGSNGFISYADDGRIEYTLTTNWTRYWVKWTAPVAERRTVLPCRLTAGNGTGTVSIRNIKFETGNVPTDWTPAPEDLEVDFFDIVRPVGSLYSTTDANFNPNAAKGWHGTWERIKDCVIYAAGDSDTVGQIVGSNTHTLTEEELPSHRHTTPQLTATGGKHRHSRSTGSSSYLYATTPSSGTAGGTAVSGGTGEINWNSSAYTEYADNLSFTVPASNTGYTGSGTAIDIRPRRLNSVVWRRTA